MTIILVNFLLIIGLGCLFA